MRRSCKPHWTSSVRPGCFSAAAPLRTLLTCSSMRWCRTPLIRPCCAAAVENYTRVSPTRSKERELSIELRCGRKSLPTIWRKPPRRTVPSLTCGRRRKSRQSVGPMPKPYSTSRALASCRPGSTMGRQSANWNSLFCWSWGPCCKEFEGFLSASVEEVYRLARSLCAEGDNAEQRFAASWGLWFVAQFQSRLGHARPLAEELIGLGEASQDPGLLLQAHHSAWTTLFALGDDCAALRHAEEGINLYDIHEHRTHSSRYGGHDPGVCARMTSDGSSHGEDR